MKNENQGFTLDIENPNLRPMPTGCMLIIKMAE